MRTLIALHLLLLAAQSAAIDVPVNDLEVWQTLEFNNIPPNQVSVNEGALNIAVRSSASPLIYGLDEPMRITGISVTADWRGALNIPEGAVQGETNADDFVLKFGIVEAGDQTLSWLQRRIAASWIKELYRLAPAGSGVRRINFLSTTQQPALLRTERTHPLSDLLYESRITLLDSPGSFELEHRFDEPVEVLGLWISADGDDTGSSFDLDITGITLHVDDSPED